MLKKQNTVWFNRERRETTKGKGEVSCLVIQVGILGRAAGKFQ